MKLTLGFSPCPNDTFIFDAMVHGRIDTEGLEFDYFLADVEELNRKAFESGPDITKMSFHAYAYAADNYLILDAGSALGFGNGPLLISREPVSDSDIPSLRIAIPGIYTTANLLFSLAWPGAMDKRVYLFSDIERALLGNEADAGIIIHETRFTYMKKGLVKLADLGEYWDGLTSLPIPLGTIAVNRRVPEDVSLKVNRIMKRSIEFARNDSLASFSFVSENAREMDREVMNRHIKLYVNDFTADLGTEGRNAVNTLFRTATSKGILPVLPDRIFLTS
ncbi:MAG: 1,4-dihydroxy-6-naphthoate synthase [Bacteroidales bacterium]|nr:1,4-dihydroxy-6-naphthoate synthase [Bacteroidales bacterium]